MSLRRLLIIGVAFALVIAWPVMAATTNTYLPLVMKAGIPPTWTPLPTVTPTLGIVPPLPGITQIVISTPTSTAVPPVGTCDASYPTVCIPSPPPDLNCSDITYRNFTVLSPDPHTFDTDHDGIGCEQQ